MTTTRCAADTSRSFLLQLPGEMSSPLHFMAPLGPGTLAVCVLAVIAAAVAVFARRVLLSRLTWPMRAGAQDNSRRAMLVFAHPDDEAMFFVPTLKALANAGWEVQFMCFTNGEEAATFLPLQGIRCGRHARTLAAVCAHAGDGGGDGSVRSRELLKSAAQFGIDESAVEIVHRRELPVRGGIDPSPGWVGAGFVAWCDSKAPRAPVVAAAGLHVSAMERGASEGDGRDGGVGPRRPHGEKEAGRH